MANSNCLFRWKFFLHKFHYLHNNRSCSLQYTDRNKHNSYYNNLGNI